MRHFTSATTRVRDVVYYLYRMNNQRWLSPVPASTYFSIPACDHSFSSLRYIDGFHGSAQGATTEIHFLNKLSHEQLDAYEAGAGDSVTSYD